MSQSVAQCATDGAMIDLLGRLFQRPEDHSSSKSSKCRRRTATHRKSSTLGQALPVESWTASGGLQSEDSALWRNQSTTEFVYLPDPLVWRPPLPAVQCSLHISRRSRL